MEKAGGREDSSIAPHSWVLGVLGYLLGPGVQESWLRAPSFGILDSGPPRRAGCQSACRDSTTQLPPLLVIVLLLLLLLILGGPLKRAPTGRMIATPRPRPATDLLKPSAKPAECLGCLLGALGVLGFRWVSYESGCLGCLRGVLGILWVFGVSPGCLGYLLGVLWVSWVSNGCLGCPMGVLGVLWVPWVCPGCLGCLTGVSGVSCLFSYGRKEFEEGLKKRSPRGMIVPIGPTGGRLG